MDIDLLEALLTDADLLRMDRGLDDEALRGFSGGWLDIEQDCVNSTGDMSSIPSSCVKLGILVYSPSGTGALNLMGSDLNMWLRPHEFLNDTLIEFGLK